MSRTIQLAVVGFGDVVRHRYLRGLAAMEGGGLELRWIFSLEEPGNFDAAVALTPALRNVAYTRLEGSFSENARRITEVVPLDAVIVLATPTPTHVPYARALAELGHRLLAIEKPVTTEPAEFADLLELLQRKSARWFPLSYYLFEKGLPFLVAAAPEAAPHPSHDLLTGALSTLAPRRQPATEEISRLVACILEGVSARASLDERPWVLSRGGGGNTWETFYHLACFVRALWPDASIEVEDTATGVVEGSAATGPGTDTARWARLRVGQGGIRLLAAKYVAPADDQRWLVLDRSSSRTVADFERCQVEVINRRGIQVSGLRDTTPYATQLRLVTRWARGELSVDPSPLLAAAHLTAKIVAHDRGRSPVSYPRSIPVPDLISRLCPSEQGLVADYGSRSQGR